VSHRIRRGAVDRSRPKSPPRLTLEALKANLKPYDTRLHSLRGFRRGHLGVEHTQDDRGSDLTTGKEKVKVQDAYSMRSTRRSSGPPATNCADEDQIEIEVNGVGRQPDLPRGRPGGSHRGRTSRARDQSSSRYAGRRGYHGMRSLRAALEPPHQLRVERGATRLSHQGAGMFSG